MTNLPLDEEAIFNIACGIQSTEVRRDYLKQACGENAPLFDRVAALLRAYDEDPSFLESPVADAAPTLDIPVAEKPGMMIGRYKLLQEIGEGGFGVVFMAEQRDPVRRKVALKVIKPGMDTRQVVARFEAERQALALMDHPNIAHVFDGGATETGRPYFVMELVHGMPITQYCDEAKLTTHERLQLFISVCDAVQHAHQKGIIHRDIKPRNVLVTLHGETPVPKIIDFGVAKATHQQLTEKTVFTGFGQMIGTPAYMSPEQVALSGLDVDTRSDVYSLGVLLYELLTGVPPFGKDRFRELSIDEIRHVIREEEPPRPSTRISTLAAEATSTISANRNTDPARLRHSLHGELDWIVMKAMEKDRTRRYASANDLAKEVQRYLDDEAVEACPPSTSYRLRKFAVRNKTRILVGSVVALAACIVLGVFVQSRWESQRRAQDASRAVEASVASAETAIATRDLSLAERKLAEASTQLSLAGKNVSELHWRVESLQKELNDAKDDEKRFVSFVQLARESQDEMSSHGTDKGPNQAREALGLFGVLVQSDWSERLKQSHLSSEQKEQVCETAYETLLLMADFSVRWSELRSEETAANGLTYLDLATQFHKPTKAYYWVNKEIHEYLEDGAAAQTYLEKYESTPARTAWDYYLPGHTAGWRGDLEAAIAAYENALRLDPNHFNSLFYLAMRLQKVGREAEAAQIYRACLVLRPDHLATLLNRANILSSKRRFDEAKELVNKAVAIGPKSALGYSVLGRALSKQGRQDEAVEYGRTAVKLDPEDAGTHGILGEILATLGRCDEAIVCFRKAIELDPKDDERNAAVLYTDLGIALETGGKLDEAIASYRRAIELDPKHVAAYANLGNCLKAHGELDEAINAHRRAIELDPNLAAAYSNLGNCFSDQGKLDEAIASYRKAIELDPIFADAYANLGVVLYRLEKWDEAIASCRKAIEFDPKLVQAHSTVGAALKAQGKLDEAIASYRRAIELDPTDAIAHNNLGAIFTNQGKREEAIACYRKAIELDPNCVTAYQNLCADLIQLGMWGEAITSLRKAIELNPTSASIHNSMAWSLATCVDPEFRDAHKAVMHGEKAVELAPGDGDPWNTLGVAYYSAGNWDKAIETLNRSIELRDGGDSFDFFFLAMAHWQLEHKDEARQWYGKAVDWMEKNKPDDEELCRFRAEAAELLGVTETEPKTKEKTAAAPTKRSEATLQGSKEAKP